MTLSTIILIAASQILYCVKHIEKVLSLVRNWHMQGLPGFSCFLGQITTICLLLKTSATVVHDASVKCCRPPFHSTKHFDFVIDVLKMTNEKNVA